MRPVALPALLWWIWGHSPRVAQLGASAFHFWLSNGPQRFSAGDQDASLKKARKGTAEALYFWKAHMSEESTWAGSWLHSSEQLGRRSPVAGDAGEDGDGELAGLGAPAQSATSRAPNSRDSAGCSTPCGGQDACRRGKERAEGRLCPGCWALAQDSGTAASSGGEQVEDAVGEWWEEVTQGFEFLRDTCPAAGGLPACLGSPNCHLHPWGGQDGDPAGDIVLRASRSQRGCELSQPNLGSPPLGTGWLQHDSQAWSGKDGDGMWAQRER